MNCRHCGDTLKHVFLDLGCAPPSNAYLSVADLDTPELHFPLKLFVCTKCWLVQTQDFSRADQLFRPDYAYFSSVSSTWLDHAARYCAMIGTRLGLGKKSFVIEVAANDGYLLKNFVAAGIPCLGIEPAAGTAAAAEAQGIPILREFFGASIAARLASSGRQADLIIGNNVFAHVPDINDFTFGLKTALKQGGTITLEFPHLLKLIEETQFDTVYHEHFSYLSLQSVTRILSKVGLRVFDVECLPTHGGSLRVYACHIDDARADSGRVIDLQNVEIRAGLQELSTYEAFQTRANCIKDDLIAFLIEQKRQGKKVAGYGAAAKGNTLLNYAGIRQDLLPMVSDAAPSKQGKFLPGSRIPIRTPEALRQWRPDFVLIFPWNIAAEVREQLSYIKDWGGIFVVAVPRLIHFSS